MKNSPPPKPFIIHHLPSVHCDERNTPVCIDTIILHSMHNPNVPDYFSPVACKEILDEYQASTHYIVDRQGGIWRLVGEEKRAWHAGVSKMPEPDGRESVNHFSIGIELIASEDSGYTDIQYEALIWLVLDITKRHKISSIYGHSHIAPDRKTDPWGFDWEKLKMGAPLKTMCFPDS